MPSAPYGSCLKRDVGKKSKGMTDQEVVLDALEQAQRILAEHMEPVPLLRPEFTINRLLRVLDRRDLALAQERLKARCGLRLVK
jgi:hypothetical protein